MCSPANSKGLRVRQTVMFYNDANRAKRCARMFREEVSGAPALYIYALSN